jgi:hypothetical protein
MTPTARFVLASPISTQKEIKMRILRLLIIALATICVLALGAFALVNNQTPQADPVDDIVIRGGSLDIQCGTNHKTDNAGCIALDDGTKGKFKHKQPGKHITRIVVKNSSNVNLFDSGANANVLGGRPEVYITYK